MRLLLRMLGVLVALGINIAFIAVPVQAFDEPTQPNSAKEQACLQGAVSFAHRGKVTKGWRGGLSENTRRGFNAARAAGACGNETDVRFARDNGCWIQHDATLERMTNGSGLLAHRTSGYIRRLRTTGSGDPVVTCRQVIKDAAQSSSRFLLLEIKDGNREQLAGLMRYALTVQKSAEFITFTSGSLSKLRLVNSINTKELETQLGGRLGFKTGWIQFNDQSRPVLSRIPSCVNALMLGRQALSVSYVAAAHSRGLLLSARGVNSRSQYRKSVGKFGADIIVTDSVGAVGNKLS